MSKPPAKAAAAPKAPAKAPARTTSPSAKPAAIDEHKPEKAPSKTVATKAASPAAKTAATATKPTPAPKAAGAKTTAAAPDTAAAHPPAPAAAGNRFTDRFAPAPARSPAHPMSETADLPHKPAHKADPKLANAWKTKPGRELSEAELLAMPDSEYMNDKQLDFFRARLQQQKDDLLSNAGETTEHLREDTSIVPDPADRATIEEEHALELRTRDRERKLLKKIAQSLARLDSGDYGYCDETGEPIGLARLLARPTATLSLEAQQRRELKQKMFGD